MEPDAEKESGEIAHPGEGSEGGQAAVERERPWRRAATPESATTAILVMSVAPYAPEKMAVVLRDGDRSLRLAGLRHVVFPPVHAARDG
jgi:hypothetical protein